jgi:hypothetical protein
LTGVPLGVLAELPATARDELEQRIIVRDETVWRRGGRCPLTEG